jgi:hypothetical protein
MNPFRFIKLRVFALALIPVLSLSAQAERDPAAGPRPAAIPLRRAALFSSGVGYFEHRGTVSGSAELTLPFTVSAVNDALKSLVINDPASDAPAVHYPSERTLRRTLQTLKIDLSGDPGIPQIMAGLKGAELDVYAPGLISGRIIGVEYRNGAAGSPAEGGMPPMDPYLSLYTSQGIRVIGFGEIASFSFRDPQINEDLNRALDLIMASRDTETRNLRVELPGRGDRTVSVGYVIPTPVWKASYRLDLSRDSPFLQGWAIVDNDGDTDWDDVELSLVTGRPVSFIQNLYPPYHLSRPVLPLAIAGTAEARTYDSGWASAAGERPVQANKMLRAMEAAAEEEALRPAPSVGGGLQSAQARTAGDHFEFTLRRPVTLKRQQSAMLPLVEGTVQIQKILVFSGSRAAEGGSIHPAMGVELVNTTGMKLPAGPITVFDGGTYAGDALIEFFPEQERRIISYGDELSVSGSVSASTSRVISSVTLAQGLMTINRKQNYEKTYVIKNSLNEPRRLILEHPITPGTTPAAGTAFDERTGNLYRFVRTLPAGGELVVTVTEESLLSERIALIQLRTESFIDYASSREIPAAVRAALDRAVELKRRADEAKTAQEDLENRRTRLISEEDRIRQNLAAAGSQTQQGQDYLKRMAALDGEIDALGAGIDTARQNARNAQKDLEAYIASLNL